MPSLVRDEITQIHEAVARRWRSIDPLLPEPGDLPEACRPNPLQAKGPDGRPNGLAVCSHQHVHADELAQTWGTATRLVLTMRLSGPDTGPAADDLLGQWRDHLAGLPAAEARADDTAAIVPWPARDVTGILALIKHGLQPITVIAARPSGRKAAGPGQTTADLLIRQADLNDLDAVTELELGVIGYDAYFGGAIPRPATPALVRIDSRTALAHEPGWTWLALHRGRPVGLVTVEPPREATWIATLTRPGTVAYLQTAFVTPGERGTGAGAALIRHVHEALDARGIDLTLLHHAQLNPLSAPFWHRMGYRPLWTTWEARPASTLR